LLLTIPPGKQRFLILARPAKPLPPDLDYEATDTMLERLREQHGAMVHRLVEDCDAWGQLIAQPWKIMSIGHRE